MKRIFHPNRGILVEWISLLILVIAFIAIGFMLHFSVFIAFGAWTNLMVLAIGVPIKIKGVDHSLVKSPKMRAYLVWGIFALSVIVNLMFHV